MAAGPSAAVGLVARPIPDLLPLRDARGPVRALIASLAPGGAERIVIEWLADEAARGREVELAVLHSRRLALAPPPGVAVAVRGGRTPEAFLEDLAARWSGALAPVSTHLITDAQLAILWRAGVRTVPVVHNSRAGWRNDPASWEARFVPGAIACAGHVRAQLLAAGCPVPVATVRHRPRVGPRAVDRAAREQAREEMRISPGTFLVGAIGAIKAQKDHPRAVEVLAALARRRDAALVILGGILEPAATAELERVLDAAIGLGVADRLRLPGFVLDVEPWLAACDAVVNVSRFEGLSMAVLEALSAGLPVVAAGVGGQGEVAHPGLEILPADARPAEFARRLERHPVRATLVPAPFPRAPRAWSLTLAARQPAGERLDTLFVTANLNAGGAQRSLVNLARTISRRHRLAIAVCGETTQPAFARELTAQGCEVFRAAAVADDFALAESILAHAARRGARNLCFWNVAPGVKLLIARFAPPDLKLLDASPGRYAFEELAQARALAEAIDFTPADYYARLDVLVLKHADAGAPRARRVVRIPNGVALGRQAGQSGTPRYLVSGRIAPSKRLETILAAFRIVRGALGDATLEVAGAAEPRHAAYAQSVVGLAGAGVAFRGDGAGLGHLDEAWTATVVLGTNQGCPNAVLEAMAAGVAVIANASGGTGELVRAGETGWLLPEDAGPDALAAAMLETWVDRDAAARRAEAARRHVATFGLEAMASRYLDLLSPPDGTAVHEKMAAWIPAAASRIT